MLKLIINMGCDNMKKYELYIDFDGVILDTIKIMYKEIESFNRELSQKEIDDFFKNYNWNGIINDKLIINDSINCIQKIIDSHKFNVSILTHVYSIEEAMEKIKYIRKYFKDITIIPCPKKISKTKMVHTNEAILVDDYSGNLKEWSEEGGIPIKFSEKNNKKYTTINKLDMLIDLFK